MKTNERKLGPFTAGVDQVSMETDLAKDALREATNVDITKDGLIRQRVGYTKLVDLTNSHSLYSDGNQVLLVSAGYLSQLQADRTTLVQLVPVKGPVSYAPMNGMIYWTDGTTLGRITSTGDPVLAWTPNPAGQPTIGTTTGNFQPGTYQVAVTFVDSAGMESGTDLASTLVLESTGGIVLTDIPQSADASYVRVYITTTNGTELQKHADIPMGTTTFYISTPFFGKPLETQFTEPMLAGNILCSHYGRLYSAVGNTLTYSESLRPGLTRLMDNYLPPFQSDITVVLSHTSGLYIVADKTYFLPGGDPDKMAVRTAYPHGGVPGTGELVTASMFDLEVQGEGEVPYWFSDNGPVVGLANGNVVPLTEKNLAPPTYASGATLFREDAGIRSMLTTLQAPGSTSTFGATDSVSFEVRRNGITIPA